MELAFVELVFRLEDEGKDDLPPVFCEEDEVDKDVVDTVE